MKGPVISRIGPDQAAELLSVVRAAFAARPVLDPPADALAQTETSLATALRHGGLIARLDGRPVGGLVFDPVEDLLFIRRFGVDPDHQGHGVAHQLIEAALPFALGYRGLAVLAREELPRNIEFWQGAGFVETSREAPYVQLHRMLPVEHQVHDHADMQSLGREFGGTLGPGDLVILCGELGAGKTTFTQGLAAGLGVRAPITSPTFVIARVHPSLVQGPDLVHADAYRLGGIEELDDLDLDTSFQDAVTVVEWGTGLAESLAQNWCEVQIVRALGGDESDIEDRDPRVVTFRRVTG